MADNPVDCGANGPGGGGFQSNNTCSGRRKRKPGMAFASYDGDKRLLASGKTVPSHVPVWPPAWSDVQVALDVDAALQVVGRDDKGRRQAIYSDAHHMEQAAEKYAKVSELREKSRNIRREIDRDKADGIEEAYVLEIIQETGIRPGSMRDRGGDKRAYGAATLQARHVIETDKGVRLQFTGKKGVQIDVPVRAKDVAAELVARAADRKPNDRLFSVSARSLREYADTVNDGSFSPKDFRTAKGSEEAARKIRRMPVPANEKEYRGAVKEVAEHVATVLGNSPTIALQSYIDPTLFSEWRSTIDSKTSRSKEAVKKSAVACGANAPGGGGFQPGNTCAKQTGKRSGEEVLNGEWTDTGYTSEIEPRGKKDWDSVGKTSNDQYVQMPSDEDVEGLLDKGKRAKVRANRDIEPGAVVGLRIDIPAFLRHGEYVVTVHAGGTDATIGKAVGYDRMARVRNAEFWSRDDNAFLVMDGNNKTTLATVRGEIVHDYDVPEDINDWVPVGYNPAKAVFFYDKKSGKEVVAGDEAVSIGNTVFVKGAEFGDRNAGKNPTEIKKKGKEEITESDIARMEDNIHVMRQRRDGTGGSKKKSLLGFVLELKKQDPIAFDEDFGHLTIGEVDRYFVQKSASNCGANAPGGGGFQEGNTCASGGAATHEEFLRGRRAKGTRVLGAMLNRSIGDGEAVSLLGQEVKSFEDLVEVAQVYRDPRYETFRAVFVSGGKVVGQNAYSSRMPAVVAFPDGMMDTIEQDAEDMRVDQVYILHNHPSGNPEPSRADIAVTDEFANRLGDTFAGHVIINHNKASYMDKYNNLEYLEVANQDMNDMSKAEVPHALLGEAINSPEKLSEVALRIGDVGDKPVAVITNVKGQVRVLLEVDEAKLDQDDYKMFAAVRRIGRRTGAGGGHRFLVVNGDKPLNEYAKHIQSGAFTDVVTQDGTSVRQSATVRIRPAKDRSDFDEGKEVLRERKKSMDAMATHNTPVYPTQRNKDYSERLKALQERRGEVKTQFVCKECGAKVAIETVKKCQIEKCPSCGTSVQDNEGNS